LRVYSLGSSGRRVAVSFTVASILTFVAQAFADDKQACSDAYAQTQTLQKERKLQAAREQALLCMKDVCAEFVRTDCTKWLAEIEASQPTVVIEVKDGSGNDILDAKVELDRQPWLATVDTQSHPIDPGSHTLRATTSKGTAEKTLVVREGDKNVRAALSVGGAAPTPAPTPTPAPAPGEPKSEEENDDGGSVAPWIIGGTGLAVAGVGTVLGILVLGKHSTYEENCVDGCNDTAIDARDAGEGLAPVSTALILGGAAILAVGVIWIIADSGSSETAGTEIHTGPVVGGGGAQWRVGGSF